MNELFADPPSPQARILIVDDEPTARATIARALNLMDYQADEADSGSQAIAKLASWPYDLVLLDLMMPEMSGMEVMKEVRDTYPDLSVIVFTGYATLESAMEALRMGAVDYLLKPCSLREIEAAVARALQRRQERVRRQHLVQVMAEALEALRSEIEQETPVAREQQERFLRCGPITLDQEKRLVVVTEGGDTGSFNAELTVNEALLLAHLMRHPDVVLSCRELAGDSLGYDVTEREAQDIIRPHISRLRSKIEPDQAHPHLIRTVRGKGYLLAPS
jgi:DNA-binding response OmpR family regulator